MSTEPEHLDRLRAAQARLRNGSDMAALREAVDTLLTVAIAHHESVGLGVPEAEVPPFMEVGEPVATPTLDAEDLVRG